MYCLKCGTELPDGAQFCMKCGANLEVMNKEYEDNGKRKQTYAGKVNKCPCCGEILGSFVTHCSSCGYELRGVNVTDSVKEFLNKLQGVKQQDELVMLIRSFPIPNTKEDIFEFMVLASSNINGELREDVFNAWVVKFEQGYQKAYLTFGTDSNFAKIQNIYDYTNRQVSRKRINLNSVKIKGSFKAFIELFPNKAVAAATLFLGAFEVIRLINGSFAPIDIILIVLILRWVYKKTTKK